MNLGKYTLAAIFLVAMAAGPGFAAPQDSEDTFTLGDIVVSGEKTSVADIGISQVITESDIKANNSTTLAEALK